MAKKNEEKQRVQIRLSGNNVEKLNSVADRYGMTVNSLVSFIVGQWLDSNYDLKEYTREKMIPLMAERSEQMFEQMSVDSDYQKIIENVIKQVVEAELDKK